MPLVFPQRFNSTKHSASAKLDTRLMMNSKERRRAELDNEARYAIGRRQCWAQFQSASSSWGTSSSWWNFIWISLNETRARTKVNDMCRPKYFIDFESWAEDGRLRWSQPSELAFIYFDHNPLRAKRSGIQFWISFKWIKVTPKINEYR